MALPAELTPAQQEVLDGLRGRGRPRPIFDPDLGARLRSRLEEALSPFAQALERPVFLAKRTLSQVLACEAHHVADAALPFEWSRRAARGTVVHKAVALSVLRRDTPPPLELVDAAMARLEDDVEASLSPFLTSLDDNERAELRGDANDLVAKFLELWPPLSPRWRPQTEARMRADLCQDRLSLSGVVDLTLGAADGRRAGRLVVDLKSGGRSAEHAHDLRYYALLDTLRVGVPPFRLATYYLDAATFAFEDVTEDVLEAAVRRTIAGGTKVVELALGLRSPGVTANPTCAWCPLRNDCEGGRDWASGLDR